MADDRTSEATKRLVQNAYSDQSHVALLASGLPPSIAVPLHSHDEALRAPCSLAFGSPSTLAGIGHLQVGFSIRSSNQNKTFPVWVDVSLIPDVEYSFLASCRLELPSRVASTIEPAAMSLG